MATLKQILKNGNESTYLNDCKNAKTKLDKQVAVERYNNWNK